MSSKTTIGIIVGIVVFIAAYLIFQNQQSDIEKSRNSVDSSKLQRTNQSDEPVEMGSKETDIPVRLDADDTQKKKDKDAGVTQGMLASPVDYGIDFSNLP